jgi:small nuclear ribonucleoprotein (snRNP)-like protein
VTVLAACILVAAGVALVAWQHLSGVIRRRRHAPLVVTLKSGSAFRGVLAASDRHAIVLHSAEALDKTASTPVDGEIIVPWADVKYMQRP